MHSWTAAKLGMQGGTDAHAKEEEHGYAVAPGSTMIANSRGPTGISDSRTTWASQSSTNAALISSPSGKTSVGARARTSTPGAPSRRVTGAKTFSEDGAAGDAEEVQKDKTSILIRPSNRGWRTYLVVASCVAGAVGIGFCFWKQAAWEGQEKTAAVTLYVPPAIDRSNTSSDVCTGQVAESECNEVTDCVWIASGCQSVANRDLLKQEIGRLREAKRQAIAVEDYLHAKELVKKERALRILCRDD
eukprot:TRINITY_DN56792_c0_g1_i1.p1 TRINITY_DN56792_c0_g1~~TRINITY_DN56792_c0_g1_i1.p1  ORF type:complete len:246 (+),score=32.27 TRINITY_DN56792_c0_g1_i1:27-764(+)